ncbi:MAG: hypothetical protein GQ529_08595, partial [Methyloprofundus sp.]|nr:hypothetical protein [Methyloprofundus sp.]
VTYKPNVDDCRETPAEPILKYFESAGFTVKYHDPHVPQWQCERMDDLQSIIDWADVTVIVTGHECYKGLSNQESLINVSGMQMLDAQVINTID